MIYLTIDNIEIGDEMVCIRHDTALSYPSIPPFPPSEVYPEYPFSGNIGTAPNSVYSTLRMVLYDLGLDQERFGTPEWNPFGKYLSKSGKVAIKPNWVWDPPYCFEESESLYATVTHSALIRAVIDFAYIAVGDSGRISVLDSPIEDTDWVRLHTWTKFSDVLRFYKESTNVPLEVIDLRDFRTIHSSTTIPLGRHRIGFVYRYRIRGDPRGYVEFDLSDSSEFNRIEFERCDLLRSPQKWTGKEVLRYHSANSHRYSISRTVLDSNLLINLPKLKHHKKAGVTLSLKGLIGVTDRKNALPHFKAGPPPRGDEYPFPRSLKQNLLVKFSNFGILKRFGVSVNPHRPKRKPLPCGESINVEDQLCDIRVGNWYGADTLWRTILDINKAALCGTSEGNHTPTRKRHYISIIDGIVGGEGESPLHPTARKANLLIASEDPVALDTVATYLMGFDPEKIPSVKQAWDLYGIRGSDFPVSNTQILFNGSQKTELGHLKQFLSVNSHFITQFRPSIGWMHHIEQDRNTCLKTEEDL